MSIKVYVADSLTAQQRRIERAARLAWMYSSSRELFIPCAKCGEIKYDHKLGANHPYFANNLEMLEWHAR